MENVFWFRLGSSRGESRGEQNTAQRDSGIQKKNGMGLSKKKKKKGNKCPSKDYLKHTKKDFVDCA